LHGGVTAQRLGGGHLVDAAPGTVRFLLNVEVCVFVGVAVADEAGQADDGCAVLAAVEWRL
jgi:hypothetical protein